MPKPVSTWVGIYFHGMKRSLEILESVCLKARSILIIGAALGIMSFVALDKKRPVLYLIGDSTVAAGNGGNGLWGWGKFLPRYFDTTKIDIKNYALGGTSTRTYYTNGIYDPARNKQGLWDSVRAKLKKGDFVMMQFGFNDQSPINDSTRSRGVLPGTGEDSVTIFNQMTKKEETVRSFGWYLRNFIKEAKDKGAFVIVCSTIPKNKWKDGKIVRGENGFANWALETADETGSFSIDLNNLVADVYDVEGQEAVTKKYHFGKDDTHTLEEGAILNASIVAKAVKGMRLCKLWKYLAD